MENLSNDNRLLDHGVLDPDRHRAGEYMADACQFLKSKGIHRETIARAALDALFALLEANPNQIPGDEEALRGDQQFLWLLKLDVVPKSEQWDQAWIRSQYEKRPTYKFNCAAARGPLPTTLLPWPDYDGCHADILKLGMSKRKRYTEADVMELYKAKLLRVSGNRMRNGVDQVRALNDSKRRILAWVRGLPRPVRLKGTS